MITFRVSKITIASFPSIMCAPIENARFTLPSMPLQGQSSDVSTSFSLDMQVSGLVPAYIRIGWLSRNVSDW